MHPQAEQESILGHFLEIWRVGVLVVVLDRLLRATSKKRSSTFLKKKVHPADKIPATPMLRVGPNTLPVIALTAVKCKKTKCKPTYDSSKNATGLRSQDSRHTVPARHVFNASATQRLTVSSSTPLRALSVLFLRRLKNGARTSSQQSAAGCRPSLPLLLRRPPASSVRRSPVYNK